MHPGQLTRLRERLLALKDELISIQDSAKAGAQPVELDQTRIGRLSRMDALQAQAMAVASNRRRDLQLQRIEAALLRMESDAYGVCLSCGEDIEARRLEFDPTVLLCVGCAARSERSV